MHVTTEKPDCVPEWAWHEYLSAYKVAVRNSGGHSDDTEMQVMACIQIIVSDRGCEPFWRAIAHRKCDLDEHGHGYEAHSTDGRLVVVLYELGEAALGMQPQNKLTATERKRKGDVIAKAASRLRQALDAICVDGCFPGWFYDGLEQLQPSDEDDHTSDDYHAGKGAALLCYAETIGAFERAGLVLAASTPDVPQSRAPTADKTRFIRFATTTMRRHYGTPLRDAVAALTRTLFKCDVDSAAVAKIAP